MGFPDMTQDPFMHTSEAALEDQGKATMQYMDMGAHLWDMPELDMHAYGPPC